MVPSIITLTSDFGSDSPYVAEMKGAILSIAPAVTLVDISHAVPPQDVQQGAMILRQVTGTFPAGSIHVAVIDPGVGTDRELLLVTTDDFHYIAPNNGLLSLVQPRHHALEIRRLDEPRFWRTPVSRTFHGRDIMGPVSAQLALGIAPDQLGSTFTDELVTVSVPMPCVTATSVTGEVVLVDSFGNLLTNISRGQLDALGPDAVLAVSGRKLPLVSRYGDAAAGTLVGLWGSSDWLEISLIQGSAAQQTGWSPGESVVLHW